MDGLVFRVLPDGESVALVGWYGDSLSANVVLPMRIVSGSDSYEVSALGMPDEKGHCDSLFKSSGIESLSIPSTVKDIGEGALSDCDSLSNVVVSPENEYFSSFDGMLWSKDLTSLLLVPEGKEGAAHVPDSTAHVPASAFSRCVRFQAVEVGQACATYSSRDGVLYSKDMKTLIACPPGSGDVVVVPQEVEEIASAAFAGCAVSSIIVLGEVRSIAEDAFDDMARSAVVVLPDNEKRAESKMTWEAAGFSNFHDSANPGDVSASDAPDKDDCELSQSDLVFKVLPDYTLSVSWSGEDAPAQLTIPTIAEIDGVFYRVSSLEAEGFSNLSSLESVVLPAGISTIGEAAFSGCTSLVSITLPDGLASIADRAFEATALSEIWLPASISSIGSRAFAECASLTRVVAVGSPEVARDALAGCSGVNIYCPENSMAVWNAGLPIAGNHLMPYAASFEFEPLTLSTGESANLLEGGELAAPEQVDVSYAYSAKPLSVDSNGVVTGKSEGATDVALVLSLDGIELTRSSRTVEVLSNEAADQSTTTSIISEECRLLPGVYLANEGVTQLSVTAPIAVTFGDANGYDVADPTEKVTSSGKFVNNSGAPVVMENLTCEDAGADAILEANSAAPALADQSLFTISPTVDPLTGVSFGLGEKEKVPDNSKAFLIEPHASLDCSYSLDLKQASVRSSVADHGMTVKPLANVSYTFGFYKGEGSELDEFYLKDVATGAVFSASEIKAHADDISAKGEKSSYYAMYSNYIANEKLYECKVAWGDGLSYNVRIIGIFHDDLADKSGKAGLTFQFKDLLKDGAQMNADSFNTNGWGASALQANMNEGVIWGQVPSVLKKLISPVKKYYGALSTSNTSDVEISNDKLFIASYVEFTGSVYSGWDSHPWLACEGEQYEYWNGKVLNNYGGNAKLEKSYPSFPETPVDWWERTVNPNAPRGFLYVYSTGYPSGNHYANNPIGVCPCFCL